jgi:hypothetical protein
MGGFSNTCFRQAFVYISGQHPMKPLHTQGVTNTYIQYGRDMLSERFLRPALRQYPHDIGRRAHVTRGQAPLPGGHYRPPLLALHLRQRRLGLWQPEGHLHTSVHLNSRSQLGARLLLLADLGI